MFSYYDKDLNVVQTELSLHKKQNMFYRPETSDRDMIKEGSGDYPTIDFKDKVVFDCGANIGSFTIRAMREQASTVIAYEPEWFNFQVLDHNVAYAKKSEGLRNKVMLKNSAVINSDDKEISFYLGKSKNSACSGTVNPSNRKMKLTVFAENFYSQLDIYKPSLIKFDIEGGEYSLLMDYIFPDYVEEIAVELHGFSNENQELMWKLDAQLQAQFPNIKYHKVCEVFQKPRLILGHYTR